MAILNIVTSQTGLVGVVPRIIYIMTNDTIGTVTTAGYLNKAHQNGFAFSDADMALVTTKTSPSATSVQVSWLEVSISAGVYSLVSSAGPGNVTLPTIANHIATYANTTGGLTEDPTTAINGGNIQAGLSGTSGYLASFPATASKGSLRVVAVANTGDTLTTLSNAAMGQASVISIPDPVNALGRLLIGAGATPFVSGNFPVASGTGGLMVDSGVAAANLQNKTNIKAATTADIGGAGAGPVSVVVAGMTAASVVVATIATSTNTVAVAKCVATATGFDVTFTADPGAACTLNYVAFIAAQ